MLLQRPVIDNRPLTTAHLAQTMTLMGMTAIEIGEKVASVLASNPALELIEDRHCPTCQRRLSGDSPCPVCSRPQSLTKDQPIVFVSPLEDFSIYKKGESLDAAEIGVPLVAEEEDLARFVLRQIAPELKPADRSIAAHILTCLDEDGLLNIPLVEIARYHHIPLSHVESVLRQIQHAEPVGVASPTPQAALLVQLEVLSEISCIPPLAYRAVQEGMDLLSRHQFSELGHLLNISTAQAREIARFIQNNLNPYPARAHWGEINTSAGKSRQNTNAYTYPDVIINQLSDSEDSPLVVEIAIPLAGTLRVNPLFREAIRQAPPEKTEQWKSDLEQASLLVKCLQQRNHTIVRLMQRLSVLQREYILHGDAYLQPITRAILAEELTVHESTISRAVSTKVVQLPNGHIVPLAYFFDRSRHIRTAIKEIISKEHETLSDTQISKLLAKEGYVVARRTVAKYRSMEGILPAHLRKPLLGNNHKRAVLASP